MASEFWRDGFFLFPTSPIQPPHPLFFLAAPTPCNQYQSLAQDEALPHSISQSLESRGGRGSGLPVLKNIYSKRQAVRA